MVKIVLRSATKMYRNENESNYGQFVRRRKKIIILSKFEINSLLICFVILYFVMLMTILLCIFI